MRLLFSPSKPSLIILRSEHEMEELEEENERLRKLTVTLKEKLDALRMEELSYQLGRDNLGQKKPALWEGSLHLCRLQNLAQKIPAARDRSETGKVAHLCKAKRPH
jgi:hypothetical protein